MPGPSSQPASPFSSTPADGTLLHELESLTDRGVGEGAYVQRLLELWRQALAANGAALYLEREAGDGDAVGEPEFLRELTVGEGTFPLVLDAGGADLAAGQALQAVPDGLLVVDVSAADGDSADPSAEAASESAPGANSRGATLSLLLATALRALRLRKQLKQQHFQVNYRVVELESVYDVGLAIAGTLDLDQLSEEILIRAVSLLDARLAAIYLRQGEGYSLERSFGGDAKDFIPAEDDALEPFLAGKGPVPEDLVPGSQHCMAVGIGGHRQPQGLIVVADKESRTGVGPFGVSDRRTLSLFANQAAIALENARLHRQALEKERLEREMELAAEIQRQILPDGVPELPGWELLGWNRPARQVGGDYYDLQRRDGGLTFTIADVTGKGIAAALLVSTLHSALHLLLDQVGVAPALFSRLNAHILESSSRNKFITLLLADLDAESGAVTYVNAGHNPGLLLKAEPADRNGGEGGGDQAGSDSVELDQAQSDVVQLTPGGLPLGLMAGGQYQTGRVQVQPGDLLCLYTDGITECANRQDEEFGEQRLIDLLRRHRGDSLEDIAAAIDHATLSFAEGLPQLDDETVILLRRSTPV